MIALSSLKPIGTHDESDTNQFNAWESWQKSFSACVYFNEPQRVLQSSNTLYVPSSDFPHLWQFVEWAAYQSDWCCIINSDILIGHNWQQALNKIRIKKSKCFTSWRYEFNSALGLANARVVDCGIDIFAACPDVWKAVLAHIPENLRIGCQQWDSWMLGAFGELAGKSFVGISNHRCIFHPKHGNRKYGGDIGKVEMMRHSVWPHEI